MNKTVKNGGNKMPKYRIGCDIGGTFTDIILFNDETKEIHVHKLLSSPAHFEESVVRGTEEIIKKHGVNPEDVDFFCHSSTVALNTLVEHKGDRAALITTEGFRDVLEIGRATRDHEYDLFQTRAVPLIPRLMRFGVR
jgi:N-methylhydantoinase A